MRLSQTNPELFKNPTLGEANPTVFLDEVEKQNIEDKAARFERREPAIARREVRYPTLMPSHTVPSSAVPVVNMISPDEYMQANENPEPVVIDADHDGEAITTSDDPGYVDLSDLEDK